MKDYLGRNWWKFLALLLLGVMIVIICRYVKDQYVASVLLSIACSFIAGLSLSFFSDVPNLISEISKRTNDAISSNKFLENFSVPKLQDIKKRATTLLYKKKNIHYQKALDLERFITESLENPVYKTFDENHVVSLDNNTLTDLVSVSYELTCKGNGNANIAFRNFFMDKYKSTDPPVELRSFRISIDNSGKHEIVSQITTRVIDVSQDANTKHAAYKTCFTMGIPHELNGNNIEQFSKQAKQYTDKETIFVSFNKSLQVDIVYKKKKEPDDNYFISGFRYPVLRYVIDFTCPENFKLAGDVFGLQLQKQVTALYDHRLKINVDNCLLLPGEGAVIVYSKTT